MDNDNGSSLLCVGYRCPCDSLLCDCFVDDLGFGLCYVKKLDGTLKSVCPRCVLKSNASSVEDCNSRSGRFSVSKRGGSGSDSPVVLSPAKFVKRSVR